MLAKVIDASALAALIFGEPDAEKIVERIGDSELVAPALLPFELASVCLKKIGLHPANRERLISALMLFPRMEIKTAIVQLHEAVALAERKQLTIYDAAYLWLANSLDCELITLDRELAAAARHG
jgi:predicted nucleic acid-binding protein